MNCLVELERWYCCCWHQERTSERKDQADEHPYRHRDRVRLLAHARVHVHVRVHAHRRFRFDLAQYCRHYDLDGDGDDFDGDDFDGEDDEGHDEGHDEGDGDGEGENGEDENGDVRETLTFHQWKNGRTVRNRCRDEMFQCRATMVLLMMRRRK